MDKLDEQQAAAVKKTSTAGLVAKLSKAGVSEDELKSLDREQIMAKWAEMLVKGFPNKEEPVVAAATANTVDIERERLQFEREKWQAEMTVRQMEREAESSRRAWERQRADEERAEREQRYRREDEEREERKLLEAERLRRENEEREERKLLEKERRRLEEARFQQEETRIALMVEANKLQCASANKERSKIDSVTFQLKQYGDAIRHSLFKMSDNPLELISFFDSVDRLFLELKVPAELQVNLLKPYLSERALNLVNRLTDTDASDYKVVKQYLMDQFRMCPQFFLEKFNRVQREQNETYKSFISRLTRLLELYFRSRKVTDFDGVCELLIVDRVKATLNESVLKHVLTSESNNIDKSWLKRSELSDVLDTYYSNYQLNDRPRASAIGLGAATYNAPAKSPQGRGQSVGHRPNGQSESPGNSLQGTPSVSQVKDSTGVAGLRRCYNCSSPQHIAVNCPSKTINPSSVKTTVPSKGVQLSANNHNKTAVTRTYVNRVFRNENNVDANEIDCKHVELAKNEQAVSAVCNKISVASMGLTNDNMVHVDQVNEHRVKQFETTKVVNDHCRECIVSTVSVPVIELKLAELNYLNVNLMGAECSIKAMRDSGSEIDVINTSLLSALSIPNETIGKVAIRPLVGSPISARLVKLRVRIAVESNNHVDDYQDIIAAACDNIHEEMILSEPTAQRLSDAHNRRVNLLTHSNTVFDGNHQGESINNVRACDVNVITRSMHNKQAVDRPILRADDSVDDSIEQSSNCDTEAELNETFINTDVINCELFSSKSGGVTQLIDEQIDDETLNHAFSLAQQGKGCYVINNGLLFQHVKYCGKDIVNLVVPQQRRNGVLKLAHNSAHWAAKKTKQRVISSGLVWPTLSAAVSQYCASCSACQLRARQLKSDKVPISIVEKAGQGQVFEHMHCDVFGPILPGQNVRFNYAVIVIDSMSRYPFACPLQSLHAKNICEALLSVFSITGICSSMKLTMDNASYYRSALTNEFLQRIGVSPLFSCEYHPEGNGLAERGVSSLKSLISKLAHEKQREWPKYLNTSLWAIRESPSETTGIAPHTLVFGSLPRGPLTILKETWLGQRELIDTKLNEDASLYLEKLLDRMQTAQIYAAAHAENEQKRHVKLYNLHARDKHFEVGEKCLVLQRDSTHSSVFSRWKGPATVLQVCSPYTYQIELNGGKYHMHANNLRKFNLRVDRVECDLLTGELDVEYKDENLINLHNEIHLSDMNVTGSVNSCSVVYDKDSDFGNLNVVELSVEKEEGSELMPSRKLTLSQVEHLSTSQRAQLKVVLDKHPEVFSDTPGLCKSVSHEINLLLDFIPKRLRAYRVPQQYKDEVDKQVLQLLHRGFIEPSNSPQASPLVVVLKQPDANGHRGIRLAVDYRWVNKYTESAVNNLEDISELIQDVGNSCFISVFDANSGYHQTLVRESDRWLTSFVCSLGQFQWIRTPFGLRNSGNTFVRVLQQVLQPIRSFTKSYVDDMAVYSSDWEAQLLHIDSFLLTMKRAGFTLGISKCNFAKPFVKYIGHLIGSGERRVDPAKVETIRQLKVPETKKQVRQILGFFSFFREYIPNFADYAKPLTDLTSKSTPERVCLDSKAREALVSLKELLCQATIKPLHIIDVSKPFSLYVDSSDYAVGAILTQSGVFGNGDLYQDYPVAFASAKFSSIQQRWATIEKEAYAALWGLQKFKHWLFGTSVTLYSDHNPLTFLTQTTSKSSKLVRWSLALQEYNVTFCYKSGITNEVADCASRMVYQKDEI